MPVRRIAALLAAVLLLSLSPLVAPSLAGHAAAATPPFPQPREWATECDTKAAAGKRLRAGKNCRWLRLDGVARRYVVVVPRWIAAHPNAGWPIVLMLHGHGGSGEGMMHITDWIAVGARSRVVTVFPTSWRYRFLNGNQGTRWATYQMTDNLDQTVRLGGYPVDGPYPTRDTEFLRRIVADVNGSIRVDRRRVHVTGSSNGGQFMSRVAVELSDLVASMSCSGWCDGPPESVWPEITRPIPVLYGLGTKDAAVLKLLAEQVDPDPTVIPLRWGAARPLVSGLAAGYLDAWRLETEPTQVVEKTTTTTVIWRTPRPKGMSGALYRLVLLLGSHHLYPTWRNNQKGHSMAALSWSFFASHRMP